MATGNLTALPIPYNTDPSAFGALPIAGGSMTGALNVTTGTAAAINAKSNSASLPSYVSFGRTTVEGLIGVSGGTSNLTVGDAAGDATVRGNQRLWLSANGAPGLKVETSGLVEFLGPTVQNQPGRPAQYTLTTLPSASAYNGYTIDVTNATGGPKLCRSNGTVWQILNTTTTVS